MSNFRNRSFRSVLVSCFSEKTVAIFFCDQEFQLFAGRIGRIRWTSKMKMLRDQVGTIMELVDGI